jgi:hypothetical protein
MRAHSCKSMLIYIYTYTHTHTYIYIHTHTETLQQIHLPRTASCLLLRRNDCKNHPREILCTWEPTAVNPCYFVYICIYTHTYIHTHTHTETGQQVNSPRTAPCLQLRRFDCNYLEREFRCTCATTAASQCYFLFIYIYKPTHTYIYTKTHT